MAENEEGFSVAGESLGRIGRVVREVETNQGLDPKRPRLSRVPARIVEGVLLEDLAGTTDPNVPNFARFQLKSATMPDMGWSDENSPSIIPVWNRTPNAYLATDVLMAIELYPNKWYIVAGAAGGIRLYHGIVLEQCSEACSTYSVQLVHRYVTAECEDCY